MSEENATMEDVGGAGPEKTLFDSIANQGGGGVLGNIVAVVPAADPAVRELRTEAGNEGSGKVPAAGTGTHSTAETLDNRPETPVLEVDPKIYTYVEDHKGRPFDPEMHEVDAKGNPVFNARGKVKVLPDGARNPVKLVYNNLLNMISPPEPDRPQEECVAQAVAQSVELERKESAEIVVDMYGGAGYVLRGAPFRKNWEKYRRGKLVNSLVRYQRIKNIVIPIKAEWILIHAFGTDLLTVEGEALFERKGGILGFIGRRGWDRRAESLARKVQSLETELEPERAGE
ncbi:MAG: hypothetical protein K9M45_01575 [Kiritimatiellales bacterium]|nr:hypothetical protein [Kiritimatiellales bacterium]